jgi:formylglycine-generating enzyme required for sulfatase activity
MEIYLHQNGERSGPYTLENLQAWLEAGQLTVADAAWFAGCSDWVTVQDVPGIMLPGGDHLVTVVTVPPFEAYQGDDPYVFISYSHKDAAVVYDEITRLHEAGINVWYDEGIEASNEWPEEIARAVVDCTVFLVFVSPRATDSVNCRNEINLALNENKPFLAIHLEETELPLGLRLRMGDLQAILRYKLPVDRYQKKTQNSLEQLLGKKRGKKRKGSVGTQEPEATHEPEPAEQAVQTDTAATSKPRRKGLAVALASVLLIACCTLGYLFLGDDGDETTTATFTPGQPWTVPTASIEMLWCEPGTFMMGSPENEEGREDREVQHRVTLTNGFFLGKYEVTQVQWKKVMGTDPSEFKGSGKPVEQVSWDECVQFCEKFTKAERLAGRLPDGWSYALPTEAEWEYACRAGTTTSYSWGNSINPSQANFKNSDKGQTRDIGSYSPNPWGFFDMHGNVLEWCADWEGDDYPVKLVRDPKGPSSGSARARRGGSWRLTWDFLRSARRNGWAPDGGISTLGFRLCLKEGTRAPKEVSKQPTPGEPWTVPTASIEMLWCEPGTFMMGSPESEEDREIDSKGKKSFDETQHQVTLTEGFYLGKYEVTQAQWKKVMGTSPSNFFGERRPVEQVNWTDVVRFCQDLTLMERKAGRLPDGWEYALPTEAQWEYACRAGTTTVFSFGDSLSSKEANFDGTQPYGDLAKGPKLGTTSDVGSYGANPWGFFDMHGNVREWCADWYGKYPTGLLTNPTGAASGSGRVARGGSWSDSGPYLRSAERNYPRPGARLSTLGFRVGLKVSQ